MSTRVSLSPRDLSLLRLLSWTPATAALLLRACHARRVTIERFIRENELAFKAGGKQVQPDCFFRLATAGRAFNLAFEIDNSTASVESYAVNSVRQKLVVYHAYQDQVLGAWL